MHSALSKNLSVATMVLLTIVMVKGGKIGSVNLPVNALLVRALQNQLKTCIVQNSDLVRSCTGEKGLPGKTVAFHVGLDKNIEDVPHNYTLKFDHVYLNEGKGYDPQTGIFTCPMDGFYAFHWTILTTSSQHFLTASMVNGKLVGSSHASGSSRNRGESSMVVHKIKKGDKAWIEPHGSHTGQYAYASWTFFSGYKI